MAQATNIPGKKVLQGSCAAFVPAPPRLIGASSRIHSKLNADGLSRFELLHRALLRSFFRTPTNELGAVVETSTREVVESDFNNFGIERFPFGERFVLQLGPPGTEVGTAWRLSPTRIGERPT